MSLSIKQRRLTQRLQSFIPAVRLTCIACFSQISQVKDEILQGLFSSHAATTVKFSSKNII